MNAVCRALVASIESIGFEVRTVKTIVETGAGVMSGFSAMAKGVDGRQFIVRGPDLYEILVILAVQAGVELMDG